MERERERETDHILEPLIAYVKLPPVQQTRNNAISPNGMISTQISELEVFGFTRKASKTFISLGKCRDF